MVELEGAPHAGRYISSGRSLLPASSSIHFSIRADLGSVTISSGGNVGYLIESIFFFFLSPYVDNWLSL